MDNRYTITDKLLAMAGISILNKDVIYKDKAGHKVRIIWHTDKEAFGLSLFYAIHEFDGFESHPVTHLSNGHAFLFKRNYDIPHKLDITNVWVEPEVPTVPMEAGP